MPGTPDHAAAQRPADLLLGVLRDFRKHWSARLEPWHISPHHSRALRTIGNHGPLRSADLAEHLSIAARSAGEVVDALVSRDLAVRTPDPDDGRAVLIDLTQRGAVVKDELDTARDDAVADFFAVLEDSERDQLVWLLERLIR